MKYYGYDYFDTSDYNIILFSSEFITGDDGPDLGYGSNETLYHFWLVTRKDNTSPWEYKGHGVGEIWIKR